MQYVVVVSEDPNHRQDYSDPDIYGPYTEQEAKDVQLLLQLELNGVEVEIKELKKYGQ